MPFLILPRPRVLGDRLRRRLAGRLCPYRETPRRVLSTPRYAVWATGLARAEAGRLCCALGAGTAHFAVRVEGPDLLVETDPLGTCPIWYTRAADGWIVSPEAKAVAVATPAVLRPDAELAMPGRRPADWSPFANVSRLAPGARLRLAGEAAVVEGAPLAFAAPRDEAGPGTDWPAALAAALNPAFAPSGEATGCFVSGGIDSAIACALARRHGPVETFSLGSEHGDEFPAARALAAALGCEHREIRFDRRQARMELDRVVFQNEVFDGLTAEILLQLSVLYGAAAATCRRIATGYGSDLLFDGMLRQPAYLAAVGLDTTPALIERTRWTGEWAPFVAWSRGLAVEHVFWRPSWIALALRVPRELCFAGGLDKQVLRDAALRAGLLPAELARRPKTSLSDGTGAHRLLAAGLGLPGPYDYGEKSRAATARLRRLFEDAGEG